MITVKPYTIQGAPEVNTGYSIYNVKVLRTDRYTEFSRTEHTTLVAILVDEGEDPDTVIMRELRQEGFI